MLFSEITCEIPLHVRGNVDSVVIVWHGHVPALGDGRRSFSSVFMCCAVNASSLIQDLITHNGSHLNLSSEGILIEHWQTSSKQMGIRNTKSCMCACVCMSEMLSVRAATVWF